jgi:hypothetical protein
MVKGDILPALPGGQPLGQHLLDFLGDTDPFGLFLGFLLRGEAGKGNECQEENQAEG